MYKLHMINIMSFTQNVGINMLGVPTLIMFSYNQNTGCHINMGLSRHLTDLMCVIYSGFKKEIIMKFLRT